MKIFSRFFCSLFLLSVSAYVAAAPLQLTSTMANADYAVERTDAAGNIHLVWTQDDTTDGRALYYRMLNASGAVLIDSTRIDNGGTGGPAGFPSMALDTAGKVYVVWQSGASPAIYFLRLNPLAHDFTTTIADLATIKEVDDVMISTGGAAAVHPRVAMDSSANLHVVWESDCTGPVQYVRIAVDANNNVVPNGAPLDVGPTGSCNGYPDIALDSVGNAHVVFANATLTMADEIYYAMIAAADGTILIDATRLSADDGLLAGSATISVNTADNKAYLVYKEETGSGGSGSEEIFIDTLDPALDPQNGSSAAAAILLNRRQFSNGEGLFRWQVFARIGQNRRLNILYVDFAAAACPTGVYAIRYAQVIYDGDALLRQDLSTTAQSCSASVRMAPNGSRIVWADSVGGNQEIFSSTISRADAGSNGFTCTLHTLPGRAASAADLWLLLTGIGLLGLRHFSRRRAG